MAGVNNPEALHRGKKCFVGRDAPLKEQLGRSHYGRFPRICGSPSPASTKQGRTDQRYRCQEARPMGGLCFGITL